MNGQANKLREKIANQKVIVFGCGSENGNPCIISEKMSERSVEHLEQITDDFSVKFAEWLRVNYYDTGNFWCEWNSDNKQHTTTELLQIFKDKYYDR